MLSRIYQIAALLIITTGLLSCEDVIDINLDKAQPSVVIEGSISNYFGTQIITISKSVNVDDASNFPAVSGATVTVSDDRNRNYVFSETKTPGTYWSAFRGSVGATYSLKVIAEGKEYTAKSTMPTPVNMDSIKIVQNNFFGDDILSVQPWYNDPAGISNYYKFTLYINNVKSKNIFVSNDEFTNGKVTSADLRDDDIDLKSGDEIEVVMQGIDKNIYHYWNGLEQNGSRGGASTTPANPVSNISNGALGYFSAQVVQRGFIKVR